MNTTEQLEKLREALAAVTPWEGMPGAIHGGEKVLKILDAPLEYNCPNRLGCAIAGYRSRDAEIESIHEGYKEQIKALVMSAERNQDRLQDCYTEKNIELAAKDAEIVELTEALESAITDIHQHLQVAKYNLRGEVVGGYADVIDRASEVLAKHGKGAA